MCSIPHPTPSNPCSHPPTQYYLLKFWNPGKGLQLSWLTYLRFRLKEMILLQKMLELRPILGQQQQQQRARSSKQVCTLPLSLQRAGSAAVHLWIKTGVASNKSGWFDWQLLLESWAIWEALPASLATSHPSLPFLSSSWYILGMLHQVIVLQ